MRKLNKNFIVAMSVLALLLVGPMVTFAATAPSLGATASYGIVSSTYTNTLNAGVETAIVGDVCYTTPPGTAPISISGATVVPCANGVDQAAALSTLNTQSCTAITGALDAVTIGANPPGTFPPGCYSMVGAMNITVSTTVTLDATAPGGDGGNVWVFRSTGALTTGANSKVVLANGASAYNVFWAPAGAAIIGANSATSPTPTFVGTIIADAGGSTGISLGHFANLLGRALAFGHTVTTDSNTITVPTIPPGSAVLRVEKSVVGGAAVPSSFNISVKNGGVDVAGSPAAGAVTPGTSYTLTAGTYTVSEVANPSYTTVFGGACASGSVTLAPGDNVLCTVVNTDNTVLPPSIGGGYYNAPLPLINVTKIPSPLNLPGGAGSVTYTYTATNVGVVPMSGVWVKDDKCKDVKFVSGDTNNDSMLDVDESWIYTCSKNVSVTETNTATAHGNANGWDGYDVANATVAVGNSVPPLIHVVKKPNVFVLPAGGGAVTYTYTVTNPGTEPLSDVSITDDKCTGLPGRVVGHPGDLNKNNLLESNESWSFTCQTNITQTTTNTGTAIGHANGMIAIDLSLATVAVSAPGLPNTGFGPDAMGDITTIFGMIMIAALSFLLGQRTRKI